MRATELQSKNLEVGFRRVQEPDFSAHLAVDSDVHLVMGNVCVGKDLILQDSTAAWACRRHTPTLPRCGRAGGPLGGVLPHPAASAGPSQEVTAALDLVHTLLSVCSTNTDALYPGALVLQVRLPPLLVLDAQTLAPAPLLLSMPCPVSFERRASLHAQTFTPATLTLASLFPFPVFHTPPSLHECGYVRHACRDARYWDLDQSHQEGPGAPGPGQSPPHPTRCSREGPTLSGERSFRHERLGLHGHPLPGGRVLPSRPQPFVLGGS